MKSKGVRRKIFVHITLLLVFIMASCDLSSCISGWNIWIAYFLNCLHAILSACLTVIFGSSLMASDFPAGIVSIVHVQHQSKEVIQLFCTSILKIVPLLSWEEQVICACFIITLCLDYHDLGVGLTSGIYIIIRRGFTQACTPTSRMLATAVHSHRYSFHGQLILLISFTVWENSMNV